MYIEAAQDNRRSAYRVRPFASDHLQLQLHNQEQHLVPDLISDITSRGASLCFEKGNIPEVEKGDEVTVRIISPDLDGKVKLMARITFTGDSPQGLHVRLCFTSSGELFNRGNRGLMQLFNRRSTYRGRGPVAPNELHAIVQTVPLGMTSEAEQRTVAVRNISTTGVCLRVNKSLDDALQGSSCINLTFQVPGTATQREFSARICNRNHTEEGLFFGCQFDWSQTPEALEAIEELTGYTIECLASDQETIKH